MFHKMLILSTLLVLILIPLISHGTHFEGGSISYKIVNTTGSTVSIMISQTYIYLYPTIYCNNSYIINQSPKLDMTGKNEYGKYLNCTANCSTSGGYVAVPLNTYCTDYSTVMNITIGERTDIISVTIGSYFSVAFISNTWRPLTLPGSGSSAYGWAISCTIDLRLRPDGTLNNPPVATIISPIYIPVKIQQVIVIPTIDADNDLVRCRYANGSSECADVCPTGSLPNGTAFLSNCTLYITGAKAGDWYAVAIMIEDFISSTSTTPLSSVPVQFLINVRNVSSCSTRPLLTGPVSTANQCTGIQVGQKYVFELVAQNFCPLLTTIQDIATLSFPVVVKGSLIQNTTTLWSVSLTWVPTASAVGSQILCAVAIDSNSVQSNQYCMTFTVAQGNVPACPGQNNVTTQSSTSTSTQTTTYTTISTTQSSSAALATTITTTQSSSAALATTITTTQSSSAALATTITTTQSSSAALATTITTTQSSSAALATTITTTQSSSAALATTITTTQSSSAALATTITTTQSSSAALATTITTTQSSSAALATTITTTQSSSAALATTITTTQSSSAALATTIPTTQSSSAVMATTITTTQSSSAALTTTIPTTQSSSAALATTISTTQSSSAALATTIPTTQSSSAVMATTITTTQSSSAALTTTIPTTQSSSAVMATTISTTPSSSTSTSTVAIADASQSTSIELITTTTTQDMPSTYVEGATTTETSSSTASILVETTTSSTFLTTIESTSNLDSTSTNSLSTLDSSTLTTNFMQTTTVSTDPSMQSTNTGSLSTSSSNTISVSSTMTQQSTTNNTTLASSTSDSTISWLWLAILLATLALTLLAVCLCLCCWCCCPRCCLWCLPKRHRKRSRSKENNFILIPMHIVQNVNSGMMDNATPTSSITTQHVDDIQLVVSTPRKKTTPHYALPQRRSPRIEPVSSPSPSTDSLSSRTTSERHLFSNQHAIKIATSRRS